MKIVEQYKSLEKTDRVMFFLIITGLVNLFLAIIKMILALSLPSLWFFLNSIFTGVLCFSRYFSLKNYSRFRNNKDEYKRKELGKKTYLNNGIILMILGLAYFFVNVYIYYKGTNTTMHEYLTYLVALIAFWSIGSSIYGMIKYNKNNNPIIKSVKMTSFANALTSIMLTQIVLLDTFNTDTAYNSNLMNGITGIVVSVVIMIIGLYMIVSINKVKD